MFSMFRMFPPVLSKVGKKHRRYNLSKTFNPVLNEVAKINRRRSRPPSKTIGPDLFKIFRVVSRTVRDFGRTMNLLTEIFLRVILLYVIPLTQVILLLIMVKL